MIRRKRQTKARTRRTSRNAPSVSVKNKDFLKEVLNWFIPDKGIFANCKFHGNINWKPEQLCAQALCWAWQETKNITNSFDHALEVCEDIGFNRVANNYPAFMQALARYDVCIGECLTRRIHFLTESVAGRFWRDDGWVLMGFDGSRVSAPRTVSNEKAFCAPNFGHGCTAKYRKKKSKGMRRKRNEQNKPEPQEPQVWITMMWHMGMRLPWTWRLGPSYASERGHVTEMIEHEDMPENTLYCGDAGFVGYPLWKSIIDAEGHFLVRVGGNVSLLSEQVDFKRLSDGVVLCWPRDQMASGAKPLKLRLVKVKIGKTTMWMLTNVLDYRRLSKRQIVKYYKMRWGIEVEFRGLKQTMDNHKLRCRNSARLLVELNWSIRAMAVAELLAMREQIDSGKVTKANKRPPYDPKDRSLANTVRALRDCMRRLDKTPTPGKELKARLSSATVQKYNQRATKKARYRPPNPDKKPLGDPKLRKLTAIEKAKLREINNKKAA